MNLVDPLAYGQYTDQRAREELAYPLMAAHLSMTVAKGRESGRYTGYALSAYSGTVTAQRCDQGTLKQAVRELDEAMQVVWETANDSSVIGLYWAHQLTVDEEAVRNGDPRGLYAPTISFVLFVDAFLGVTGQREWTERIEVSTGGTVTMDRVLDWRNREQLLIEEALRTVTPYTLCPKCAEWLAVDPSAPLATQRFLQDTMDEYQSVYRHYGFRSSGDVLSAQQMIID